MSIVINWLIGENHFVMILTAGAVLTPVMAGLAYLRWPYTRHKRTQILLGVSGPVALGLWGIHAVLIRQLGFDSVYTVVVGIMVALGLGISAGFWAGGENQ